jgi:ABC-2 type transport system permease protein
MSLINSRKFRKSLFRVWAMVQKEFVQMRRDRVTLGMIVSIPLIQLIMFGFAINLNPSNLPAAVVGDVNNIFAQKILVAMKNSTYFKFLNPTSTEEEAQEYLNTGKVQFVVNFPENFAKNIIRGKSPKVLLQADATDPAATGRAVSVFENLAKSVLNDDLVGSLDYLKPYKLPYTPIVHSVYNPLAITAYNIVPGLLGVVLTMTLVIITALVITKEYEFGTMENLLATPLHPLEVMLGKIIPYVIVGYIQVSLILFMAKFIFAVPMQGSLILLFIMCFPYIIANLSVGLTFSTIASNQLQAVQSAMFFFLPSILLSGFMFPFRGMPTWAQYVGDALPLTHFLIIVRGILLKGNGFIEVYKELFPIAIFTIFVMCIAFFRYRKTLD